MNRQGFTILEILIVSMISLIVVTSAYQLMISQSRLLASQNAVIDSRDSSRRIGTLLSSELRNASSAGGDLYVLNQEYIVLRSYQARGVMCSGTIPFSSSRSLGLQNVDGNFTADSARVYSIENARWSTYDVTDAWNGVDSWTAGSSPVCFWGDSTIAMPRPQAAIKLAGNVDSLATVGVGGSVRVFRPTRYGLFPRNGKWYMGRRVVGGSWELLTGPMHSPANGGLTFTYYDANDVVTADPLLVSHIVLTLRSESDGKVSGSGTRTDSLSMTLSLRNN